MVRHLRCARALTLRKGIQLIILIRWIKNNDDEDYDGHDDHSVTNDNLAQSVFLNRGRSNVSQMHGIYTQKTQATRKSIGNLCGTKLNWLVIKQRTRSTLAQ